MSWIAIVVVPAAPAPATNTHLFTRLGHITTQRKIRLTLIGPEVPGDDAEALIKKEGHKTVIIYDELQFDPPEIDESIFTMRNLRSRF